MSDLPVDLAAEPDDAPSTGIGDELDLARLSRFETHGRAGRDIETTAARLVAVEVERRVGLEKRVVGADLDRHVAGVRDGESDAQPPGIQLDISIGRKQVNGDGRNVTLSSGRL